MTTATKPALKPEPKPDPRTPRIRRRLGRLGLPDLQVASGARTQRQLRAAERAIDKLIDDRQVGVLRALMDSRSGLTVAALVDLDRRGELAGGGILATVALRENLWPIGTPDAKDYREGSIARLLPKMGRSEGTRARYAVAFAALKRKATDELGPKATLADLGVVDWTALSARWGTTGADWNNMRRAVSRLLSLALGDKFHPARREIMNVDRFPRRAERKREDNLTLAAFWQIVDVARIDVQPALVTLLLTGMRVDEYLACDATHLRPATCAVQVPGTKTEGSAAQVVVAEEHWPWIVAAVPPPLAYGRLRREWCTAVAKAGLGTYDVWFEPKLDADGKPMVTARGKPVLRRREHYEGPVIHSLRHAHATFATAAGVSLIQVKASMRHATLAMTARYAEQAAKGEVAAALGAHIRRGA